MNAATHNPESPGRHSALAWSCAVTFSVAVLAARFDVGPLQVVATILLVVAAAAWIVEKWTASAPTAEIRSMAKARAWGWLGVLAFWLWTGLVLAYVFTYAYAVPSTNRAYAEELGVELTPFFAVVIAVAVAASIVAVLTLLALRGPAPASRPILRAACFVVPIASVLLAFAPVVFFPDWNATWRSFGMDLPGPTLHYQAIHPYWGILSVPAVAFAALAWAKRARAVMYARAVVAGLFVLMLCSALLAFAVAAAWLPVMKMCTEV